MSISKSNESVTTQNSGNTFLLVNNQNSNGGNLLGYNPSNMEKEIENRLDIVKEFIVNRASEFDLKIIEELINVRRMELKGEKDD